MSVSRLINRNVVAAGGRTSMRLEPELWDALREICEREKIGIGDLIRSIEARGHSGGRTSAVRVHIVEYFRAAERSARNAGGGRTREGDPDLSAAAA